MCGGAVTNMKPNSEKRNEHEVNDLTEEFDEKIKVQEDDDFEIEKDDEGVFTPKDEQ